MANNQEEDPWFAAALDPEGEFAKMARKANSKKSGAPKTKAFSMNNAQADLKTKEEKLDLTQLPLGQRPTEVRNTEASGWGWGDEQPKPTTSENSPPKSVHARPRVDEKLDTYELATPSTLLDPHPGQYSGITQMNLATRVESFESSVVAEIGSLKQQIADLERAMVVRTGKRQRQDIEVSIPSINATGTSRLTETALSAHDLRSSTSNGGDKAAVPTPSLFTSLGKVEKADQQDESQRQIAVQAAELAAKSVGLDSGNALSAKVSQDLRYQPGMPSYISQLEPYSSSQLQFQPLSCNESPIMTRQLLIKKLGGEEFAPNFYHKAKALAQLAGNPCTPIGKDGEKNHHECFYLLDMETNPFAPIKPGAHGAALILFSRDPEDDSHVSYNEVPVFVALTGQAGRSQEQKEYIYMGHYSQSRWSDRLSYYEQKLHIFEPAKKVWGDLICRKRQPVWLDKQLDEWIDRGPSWFSGVPLPGCMPAQEDLEEFFEELRCAKRDCEETKAGLTHGKVMKLFDAADCDAPTGLRFSWEYLECVHYDRNFAYAVKSSQGAAVGNTSLTSEKRQVSETNKSKVGGPLDSSTAAPPVEEARSVQFSWD